MSKLTKIILINWMYFQKAILPIEGNTAIVGINGSGKSTIIDAIQMLLLGQKQSKFNSGASAEKRTLESYVRGHVASDAKEYLRDGDVITYLALEVDIDGVKHIFGINIEYKYNTNKLMDPKYFYIKNCELDEELFITPTNYPKPYDDFNKSVRKTYEFVPFQTLMTYQNKVKEIFGLKLENSYFKILSRAIGLKNINSCDKFMNEFVLDEAYIDVSEIKNNILEMTRISNTIDREDEKLQKLVAIVNNGNNIVLEIEELKDLDLKGLVGDKLLKEANIEILNEENNKYNSLIEETNNKKISLANANLDLNKSKAEHLDLLDNKYPDLSKKQRELDEINKQYDENHLIYNTFITKCNSELSNLSNLKEYKNKILDSFYLYLKNSDFTSNTTKDKFIEFKEEVYSLSSEAKSNADRIRYDLEKIRNELNEKKDIINKLENNEHPFDNKYLEAKNIIQKGLFEKYHEDIEVKFLCEYLDIIDEAWRNAIEGYLGNQRFYLIVPNNYYIDALKIYYNNKNISGVRLINGLRLPLFDKEEGTLGSFIEASNDTALNYARLLLNRVKCVDKILDLDKYDIAITKDCMCYQNYSSWRIPAIYYKKSFIGIEGLKRQLKIIKEEYQEINELGIKLLGQYNSYNYNYDAFIREIKFVDDILSNNYINSIDLDKSLSDRIEVITEEIKYFKSSKEYLEITNDIVTIEKKIKENDNLIEAFNNKLIDYNSSIKSNIIKIDDIELCISTLEIQLENFDNLQLDAAISFINQNRLSEAFLLSLKREYTALNNRIIKQKSDLENQMRDVRDKFNINCEPIFEQLNSFKEEKNKINSSIFKYRNKLIEMQKSHRKLFFSEFLSKLYTSIEQAKEIIKNLNASLATFTFGNDYYSIKIGITENQELKTIYNYAKEFNSDNSDRGIFVDRDVEDRERQKVEELLNQYIFSDNVNTQAIIVDYRNYLFFDVEVHTPNGTKSLNKVIRSQSGGEVQVPFYILSGVAFKQTLDFKRNKDSLGIVLYDEAFDKMDSQRIKSMLQFYRDKLGLQVILATPGKLDSLVDNIETILAVVRDGDKSDVSGLSHEL